MISKNKTRYITPVGGNIFSDLGFSQKEAASLLARSKKIISKKLSLEEPLMTELSLQMRENWIDPDDAPELNEGWFQNAHVYIGDTLIKRGVGRPPIKNAKEMLSLRLDSDVLEKLRASGKGWQTRLSKHIKEAVLKGAL
jgi:uncharacterized protein (DUF4415 family)